jgi:hypothetical protein
MNTVNESHILRWSLILGIVIVLNLFFNFALSLVYERPDYEAFCPQMQVSKVVDNQNECVAGGGQWTEYGPNNFREKPLPTDPKGYCDLQFTCRQEYDGARNNYDRNVFVILVVLGALVVLMGNLFKGNEVISSSLALAGLLSFLIASVRYWSAAGSVARVVILAIALGILFWIAWKKFGSK